MRSFYPALIFLILAQLAFYAWGLDVRSTLANSIKEDPIFLSESRAPLPMSGSLSR
jgi:hypothetical protein